MFDGVVGDVGVRDPDFSKPRTCREGGRESFRRARMKGQCQARHECSYSSSVSSSSSSSSSSSNRNRSVVLVL